LRVFLLFQLGLAAACASTALVSGKLDFVPGLDDRTDTSVHISRPGQALPPRIPVVKPIPRRPSFSLHCQTRQPAESGLERLLACRNASWDRNVFLAEAWHEMGHNPDAEGKVHAPAGLYARGNLALAGASMRGRTPADRRGNHLLLGFAAAALDCHCDGSHYVQYCLRLPSVVARGSRALDQLRENYSMSCIMM
jgi:hypothetical protein